MNNELKINIFFGCSIILKYYYIFEQLIINKIFNKIFVSIDYNILNYYRNSDIKYFNNYIIFLKYINDIDNIIIENDYNSTYETIELVSLSNIYNIPIKFKIFAKLVDNYSYFSFDYITISTKILNIDYNLYENFKEELFNKLNKINYKIILLGERKITACKEYLIHNTYTIYDDLIKNLDNYEDLTICDNSENNDLIPLLKTLNILNKSKLNIYMSNGGISELLSYSSKNILGLTNKENLLNKNNHLEDTTNIKIFDNHIDFLDNLRIK